MNKIRKMLLDAGKTKYKDKYKVITERDIFSLTSNKIISTKEALKLEGLVLSKRGRR
jgi:uncharacterized protein (DUF342 family)